MFLIRQLPTLPTPLITNLHFNYCLGANLRNYIDYINVFKNRWNVDWHGSYDCGRPHSACVRTYAVKITKLSPDVGPYKFTHKHKHTHTHTHTHMYTYRQRPPVASYHIVHQRYGEKNKIKFSMENITQLPISFFFFTSYMYLHVYKHKIKHYSTMQKKKHSVKVLFKFRSCLIFWTCVNTSNDKPCNKT